MAMQCGGENSDSLLAISSSLYNSLAYFSRVNAMVNHSLLCKTNIQSKAQSKYSQQLGASWLIKSQLDSQLANFYQLVESKVKSMLVLELVGRQLAWGQGKRVKFLNINKPQLMWFVEAPFYPILSFASHMVSPISQLHPAYVGQIVRYKKQIY